METETKGQRLLRLLKEAAGMHTISQAAVTAIIPLAEELVVENNALREQEAAANDTIHQLRQDVIEGAQTALAEITRLREALVEQAPPKEATEPTAGEALLDRIIVDPQIFGGKPIIRGQRLAVGHVLGMLSAGDSRDDLLKVYPSLTRQDILACLAYARRVVDDDREELVLSERTLDAIRGSPEVPPEANQPNPMDAGPSIAAAPPAEVPHVACEPMGRPPEEHGIPPVELLPGEKLPPEAFKTSKKRRGRGE